MIAAQNEGERVILYNVRKGKNGHECHERGRGIVTCCSSEPREENREEVAVGTNLGHLKPIFLQSSPATNLLICPLQLRLESHYSWHSTAAMCVCVGGVLEVGWKCAAVSSTTSSCLSGWAGDLAERAGLPPAPFPPLTGTVWPEGWGTREGGGGKKNNAGEGRGLKRRLAPR